MTVWQDDIEAAINDLAKRVYALEDSRTPTAEEVRTALLRRVLEGGQHSTVPAVFTLTTLEKKV